MKQKKLLALLFIAVLILGFANTGYSTAFAKEPLLDEADRCLIDTFDLMAEDEMVLEAYSRQELFDYDLEQMGYAYTIRVSGNSGYALMIRRAMFYEVTEIYFAKDSPYRDIAGQAVYITPFRYIEFINDSYVDILTGEALDDDMMLELSERGFGFKGGTPGQILTETVTYTSRNIEEANISGKVPAYFDINPALTNSCAVVAGSVLVGFYSRYYPELTPNFVVGRPLGTSYTYYGQGTPSNIQNVINDLYVRMGTNIGGAGTTAAGFRNGLSSYFSSKGKTVTYTNVVNNNNLDYNAFKGHIGNARPVVLFFNTYNILNDPCITTTGNTDSIERQYFSGMHVMVGYGYKKVMYLNGSTNFRTDIYIKLFTGFADVTFGYVRLYDGAILQEGYAVSVT